MNRGGSDLRIEKMPPPTFAPPLASAALFIRHDVGGRARKVRGDARARWTTHRPGAPELRHVVGAVGLRAVLVLAALIATTEIGTAATASPTAAVRTGDLRVITEPDAGMAPIYGVLSSARKTLDLTMYELSDPAVDRVLAADAERGVRVRVLLDKNGEQSANEAAFGFLDAHHVAVRWAPPGFERTHEKAAVIDGTTALIMTLNFTSRYYTTTRDFAVVDTLAPDVAAVETVFAADWNATPVSPPDGEDLVWSPGAQPALVGVVDSARHTVSVENEEMDDRAVTAALIAAARRGVDVKVVMTRSSEWTGAFDELAAAGAHVSTYSPDASRYIHAKVIIVDAGLGDQKSFVGSENLSVASLSYNRELGIITSSPSVVAVLDRVILEDYSEGELWHSS